MSTGIQRLEGQAWDAGPVGRVETGVVAEAAAMGPPRSWRTMGRLGLSMLFHERLKLVGTLMGVVFAVLLSNFQVAIFEGLILRNTMFVERSEADIWVVPHGTLALQGGGAPLPDTLVSVARTVPGVAWSAPLLMGNAAVQLPEGGQKPVLLVGTEAPAFRGGPLHVVAGKREDLQLADGMFFEGSRREQLGNLDVGSLREVNGHRARVVGFTHGLVPFGPTFAFAELGKARELLRRPVDEVDYVMVGLDPSADLEATLARLREAFPSQLVLSRAELRSRTVEHVLRESGIGKSIGSGVAMSVTCGFAIVALTMFSAVLDRMKQFGTLKALGATNGDLTRLLLVQAVTCAGLGVLIGEAMVTWLLRVATGPEQPLELKPWLMGATLLGMTVMCVLASVLAVMRVRKIEPALVFRG